MSIGGRPLSVPVPVAVAVAVAVALSAIVAAASVAVYFAQILGHPDQLQLDQDLQVYYGAGRSLTHLYSDAYGSLHQPFTYPPFAALLMSVPARLAFRDVQWITWTGNVLALMAVLWLAWGLAGYRRNAARVSATLLTTSVALWLEPFQQNTYWGQVNVLLMLLVLADYALPDRSRWKGVGIGLAAGFKLTPAIHIAYLLLTGRRRQAATATATFTGTILLGGLVLPHQAARYWLGGLFDDPKRVGTSSFLTNQSLHGLIGRALHDGPGIDALWLPTALPVAVLGVLLAAKQGRQGRELHGILTTAVTGLLISPVSWTHHWVWIVLALVLSADRVRRRPSPDRLLPLAAMLVLFGAWSGIYDWWPTGPVLPLGVLWGSPHAPPADYYTWHGTEALTGNLYTLWGLGYLALSACLLRQRHRPATQVQAQASPAKDRSRDLASA